MHGPELACRICARLSRALAFRHEALIPLRIDDRVVGRLTVERAERLESFRAAFRRDRDGAFRFIPGLDASPARSAALAEVTRTLADEGALTAWRDELYAVAPAFGAPRWFHLERAAARYFGVRTYAAHVNGLLRERGGDVSMWVARRSATKAIDPGLLDNLVGGGIAAGMGVTRTIVKEAWEEAGIPAALAGRAQPAAVLHVERQLPDGLQDEIIFAHDLWLPGSFVPTNQDGEAVEQRRLPLEAVAALLAHAEGQDAMTVDASLVALTALLRTDSFDAGGRALVAALLDRVSRTS